MTFIPKPGDFEVVPMGGAGGKWIKIGQILKGCGFRASKYQHARMYVGDGKCVEAEPGGARVVDYDPHDGGMWSTGAIELKDTDRQIIVNAAFGYARVKTGYSIMDYFALVALRLKLYLIYWPLKEYVRTSKHMICSQLVDQCYQDAHVELFDDDRFPGDVAPADLANLLFHRWG